jgi:hypothetical protein
VAARIFEHQVNLALRALALSARPMAQRLEGACIELGLAEPEGIPDAFRPLVDEIGRTVMARGRQEATIAAMPDHEREALAAKIYDLFLAVFVHEH